MAALAAIAPAIFASLRRVIRSGSDFEFSTVSPCLTASARDDFHVRVLPWEYAGPLFASGWARNRWSFSSPPCPPPRPAQGRIALRRSCAPRPPPCRSALRASVVVSNSGSIRGSRGRDISIERRRRHTEAVRDLGNANIGIGKQCSRDVKVVFRQLHFGRRPPVRPRRRAAARPAWVRSRIRLRSNSASAPNM